MFKEKTTGLPMQKELPGLYISNVELKRSDVQKIRAKSTQKQPEKQNESTILDQNEDIRVTENPHN